MKHIVRFFLLSSILVSLVFSASAEIYINQQPPADWADKPLLRLTTFPAVTNDAALLEVDGLSMLIDGGVAKWTENVRASLTELGYGDGVDVIFNTHPHEDHIACETALVEQGFQAGAFWSSFPQDEDDDCQRAMVAALEAAGIPYYQLQNGEEMDWGGARLVFWYYPDGRDYNALSCMMHITYGDATMLLTADASTGAQDYFHKALGSAMQAQVMKFPHHGYTIARPAFLDDVQPEFAYVTSRQKLTKNANSQLRARKIKFKHTSIGPLTLVTDGTDWYIWQENAPY